jgi:PAS domain S-box-containing protein
VTSVRKRSDDERAKTEGILAAIGEGIRVINRRFRIVYENQKHKDLLGNHAGEYCYSAYQQRDRVCEMCPIAVTLSEGRILKVERTMPAEKGTMHLGITASPLTDSKGRIIAAVVVVRDITERKLMEAERERLIADLQGALAKIKTLSGLIPVCAWCRRVRDDQGYWDNLENYIRENSDANFTHGICPECLKKTDPDTYNEFSSIKKWQK